MPHLDHLLKYVRTGTAEGDRAFLGQVFITPDQLVDLLGIEPGGMRVLVGNKGMGKTAIVEWLQKVSHNRNLACVLLRPDNLETKELPASQDVGALKRHFYETLLRSVCGQVGSQLKGLLVGNAAKLYKSAQAQGLASQDMVQKSLTLLSAVATPVANVDGVRLAKELAGSDSPNALIRAINGQLLSAGSVLFLLIDDTDQVASPSTPAHLNRIWALLLAVRRLVGECNHIRAIVTLRSEVWSRLTSESDGQRDQTDHLRGSRVLLRATDRLIESIIRKRLEEASKDAGVRGVDPYTLFFSGTEVTLPTSTEQRTWDSFLVKSSRDRPRDAIQLIKNMIDRAKARGTDTIGSAEADEAMKIYSKERLDDLNNEFAPDCSSIRQIISTFSDVEFEVDFETTRQHIRSIPSSFSVTVRGEQLKPQDDHDAITILSLLHEAGFINPRVPDVRQSRNFRHILFHDNAHFVKMVNWNEMQGATWEIHPAFRSFLIDAKRDTLARAVNKPPVR
ncbi:MAG: hypothetical protein WA210_05625 [Burkholderiaceae bacterium]